MVRRAPGSWKVQAEKIFSEKKVHQDIECQAFGGR